MSTTKLTKAAAALGVITASSLVANAGIVNNWDSPVNGNWNLASNWSLGSVPGDFDGAILGHAAAYIVSFTGSDSVGNLDIANPLAQLNIFNATTLTTNGTLLNNNGLIVVNSIGSTSVTTLRFEANSILDGTGSILLNGSVSRARIQTGLGITVTQSASHLIEGRGQIEAVLVNNGTVRSNVASAEMRLVSNPKTNNLRMEAINGARLDIDGITITQGVNGVIHAGDAGSLVELRSATIIGGSITSGVGAQLLVAANGTLDSVFTAGQTNVANGQTLTLLNGFTNSGTLVVNSNGSTSVTTLLVNDSMTISGPGSILLNGSTSRARIRTGPGATMTIPPNQTIEGRGQIEGSMINNGLIQSNVPAGEMRLVTNDKTNNATMEAISGATLDINGITVTQFDPGVIRADGIGSRVELGSSTIIGGDLTSINGADITVIANSTIDGVDLTGIFNIPNAATLSVSNSITNDGVLTVNSNGSTSITTLFFNDSMTLAGNGSVLLNGSGSRARIQGAPATTLTIPSTHLIEGRGQIETSFINNGIIQSNVLGDEMRLISNSKTNNASIQAINGARLDIFGITVTQGASGEIRSDGVGSRIELGTCTIIGGDLASTNDADITVTATSTLDAVDFSGLLNIPNTLQLGIKLGTLNNGLIVVNSNGSTSVTTLLWEEEMILGGTGTIRLNSSASRARLLGLGGISGGIGSEQRLEGIGQIAIDLINDGTIAPGLSVGTMTAIEPIFFAGTANFEAEVNAIASDLLDSTSTIELHGTLDVLFIDGFAPTGFWARTIIQGTDITGEFDTINVPPAPSGLVTKVLNTGTEIIVGQTCPADANIDGVLDFFDVSKFLAQFAAMDPAADFNNDGDFDFFDVSLFLGQFGAGCP